MTFFQKCFFGVFISLLFLLNGCTLNTELGKTETIDSSSKAESVDRDAVRVSMDAFEITYKVVDDVPVFWVKNNSSFVITGPKLKMINLETDQIFVAYEWKSTIKPGETSSVVSFVKDGEQTITTEEFESASLYTFEVNYENDDGSNSAWFEYNYITETQRGFDY